MQTMTLSQLELDSSILLSLKTFDVELAYLAIRLYQKKQQSLDMSTQFIGISRLKLIDIFRDIKIAVFYYNNIEISKCFNKLIDILSNKINFLTKNNRDR